MGIKGNLQEDGYAVISMFTQEDLACIGDLYNQHHLDYPKGEFFATMFHSDLNVKLEVSRGIAEVLERNAGRFFSNYKCLFANFLVKAADSIHSVGIHQDWSYINETSQVSYNVWSALEDTTKENGGLFVLPKSHTFRHPYRGTPFDDKLYNLNEQKIKERALFVPTKAGEAIIYDSRLIHYSLPNISAKHRIAFAGIMIPVESEPLHYFQKNNKLLKYQADETFFCTLVPDQEPNYSCKEEIVQWYRPKSSDLSNFILSLEKQDSSSNATK